MKTQNKVKLIKSYSSAFGIFNLRKLSVPINNKQKPTNRWHLSAEGFLLLPSALRPHLLGKNNKNITFCDRICVKIASIYSKNHQKLHFFTKMNEKFAKNTQFLAIFTLFQIVALSTIFTYLCSTPVSATSLTLTIPSSFSLDITPGPNGVFSKSSKQSINVKTDNSSGYTLSIKANNSDDSNSLINNSISSSSGNNNKLNSISESTAEDNFRTDSRFNNSWGYIPSKFNNEDNSNFLPGPTSEESILESTEEASETGTDYNITIGAKVDNTMSSGSYNNSFIIQASANVLKPTTLQGFGDYCKYMKEHQSLPLTDTRDSNTYTVAKLKDGNCWMTENLRIQNKEVSSQDSAIEEGTFTIPVSNLNNFGTYQKTSNVYVDTDNNDNGGYYSWYAATAGQGNIVDNISVNSICPKGWHLPTKEEFSNLIANSNYDSDSIKATPANFTTPGYVNNKKISSSGTYGYYWSASNYNGSTSYSDAFNVYSSSTSPKLDYWSRYYGNSIRCIAGDIEVKDYSIKYDLNGGSDGPSENPQTGKKVMISSASIELSSKIPMKDGYAFKGWCTTNPGESEICSEDSYYAKADYPLSNGIDITLYATWRYIPPAVDKGSLGTMQNFDCNSTLPNIHEYGTVTDSRDDNTYKVARLMDDKCWMIENLRIADKTLTYNDSDVSGSFSIPASVDEGFNSNNQFAAIVHIDSQYGGYYNWNTAVAGDYGSYRYSICPKGWRLPTGGLGGDFPDLVIAYGGESIGGSTNLQKTPVPGFALSGYYWYSAVRDLSTQGRYWASTKFDYSRAQLLHMTSISVSGRILDNIYYGYPIRCVTRE